MGENRGVLGIRRGSELREGLPERLRGFWGGKFGIWGLLGGFPRPEALGGGGVYLGGGVTRSTPKRLQCLNCVCMGCGGLVLIGVDVGYDLMGNG